ncbi:AGPAT3.2 family protein [Megaselia abdita]
MSSGNNPLLDKIKHSRLSHLSIAITFFVSGLIINSIQLVLHLTLKRANKKLFRQVNWYLNYAIFSQLVFIADWWSASTLKVWMDEDDLKKYDGQENVLLMMNHTYEIDWLSGWQFTEKMRVLGNCKAYAKKVISYVPVIGWAWYFAEFIFLNRSYDKDKEIIDKQLREVYSFPDPVWLLLNAEGTRFTEKKHAASVKFAQEKGMTVLKHHLIPRTKGFTASLPGLREKCDAIYDINLAFKKDAEVAPTISNLLHGYPVQGYMYVRRIPFSSVPEKEEEAAKFLQNLFVEKDNIIDSFHTTGSFFKTSGFKEPPSNYMVPRIYSLVNFIVWALISILPLMYFLIYSLLAANWTGFFIVVSILAAITFMMKKSIGMSKISKASAYGDTVTAPHAKST